MSDESSQRLGLFDAFGVELEYMIVAKESLDVQPVCDRLIEAECGAIQSDVERGEISWSNELVLHVVELKTTGPSPSLQGLSSKFHSEVRQINRRLGDMGCRLMPSAMHPYPPYFQLPQPNPNAPPTTRQSHSYLPNQQTLHPKPSKNSSPA